MSTTAEEIHIQSNVKENSEPEIHKYDVEMNNLMSIIINSMYSSKDYFMRELISNCSDACDKLNVIRTELRDGGQEVESDLKIKIMFGENRLIIQDNGIGMTKDELVKYLGCVANSGTKQFREAVKNTNAKIDDLIGQFGLGFYASFLVADHVTVISRYPGQPAYEWQSSGLGQYSVRQADSDMTHGTSVVLQLKEGCKEYLKKEKVTELVRKYSMFVSYPIMLVTLKKVDSDQNDTPKEDVTKEGVTNKDVTNKDVTNKDVTKEGVTKEDTPKDDTPKEDTPKEDTTKEDTPKEHITKEDTPKEYTQYVEEQLNKEKPLWSMKAKDITREMYSSFYKTISNDWDDYLSVKHSHLEGSISFDVLLFAPKRPPFNMFQNQKKKTIKLYCSSVFITDELDLPEWMQCVSGVISSKDLPINVSREFLQGSNVKRIIKKTLVKKTIELLRDMSPETYREYYREFSSMIKLAVRDEQDNLELDKLLRFDTNRRENISLMDYCKEMKEDQKDIYIITGLSKEEVVKSPFVRLFSDYEIIFMVDTIDEYLLQKLKKFDNKNIVKINQEGIELPNTVISDEMNNSLEPLKNKIFSILENEVEKVEFKNLGDRHMIIQTPKHSISPAMEKILSAQVSLDKSNMFMFPKGKKILQVNVSHPLTFRMNSLLESESELRQLVNILFKLSCLQCGYNLDDPVGFSDQVVAALSDCPSEAPEQPETKEEEEVV